MALQRQVNFLGQQRLDVPHLRMLESGVAADFDALAGRAMAGQKALVLKGFELVTASAVGQPATSLQMTVAGGVLIHPLASEAGSVFTVATSASVETLSVSNAKVEGAFVANTTNYVGIDLRREEDDSSADLVMFLNALTFTETPRTVPLARTLGFKIIVSTIEFSGQPNVCPVAKVVTNSSNNVVSIEDSRALMFRLGAGGSGTQATRALNTFSWSGGRAEGVTTADAFQGGDKAIGSLKDWQDAVMTRLWELGGGERWYGMSSDREVKLAFGQPVLGNGDNFDWNSGTSTIQWTSLALLFANSTALHNPITNGSTTLADGECLYVDANRFANTTLTMQKAARATLGAPTIPGSRVVIAWRRGTELFIKDKQYEAGRLYVGVASTSATGTVKLSYAAGNPADPVVAPRDANGVISNTASGGNGQGFFGTGNGTGPGVRGTGGASNGAGGQFTGGGAGGIGVVGTGTGAIEGGQFTGGSTSGIGVRGIGGATNGVGVRGEGTGAGAAFTGTGGANGPGFTIGAGGGNNVGGQLTGAGSGEGLVAVGGSTGTGVRGQGGASGGVGVVGTGTSGNAGMSGTGQGAGAGVLGQGGATGHGVSGTGGATSGDGVRGQGGPSSPGVRGTGGSAAAGVIGVGGTTSGKGGDFTGTGSGDGILVTAGATATAAVNATASGSSGRAFVGVGGTAGGAQIDVTGTVAGNGRSLTSTTNALTLRNTQNANDSVVAIQMLHADATSPQDGYIISSQRIADNNTTWMLSYLASSLGSTAFPAIIVDGATNPTVGPGGDNAQDLGKTGTRWKNVFAAVTRTNALVMPPGSQTLSGVNPTITVGDNSYLRINGGTGSGTLSMASGSYDGQIVTIINVGGAGNPTWTSGSGKVRLSTASFTLFGAGNTRDNITFIYDATFDEWIEIARTNIA